MHGQQNIINLPLFSYVIMASWSIKDLENAYLILSLPNNFLSTLCFNTGYSNLYSLSRVMFFLPKQKQNAAYMGLSVKFEMNRRPHPLSKI